MDIQIHSDYREDMVAGLDIESLARLVIEHEGKPDTTEVSISFVDDDTIAELNGTYRGVEGPTDVLSFECDGYDDDFEMGGPEGAEEDAYALGDIFIAVDVAERQTALFGTTFAQEVYLLTVHGLLHLCGYDHMVDEEAEVMEALEQVILDKWYESQAS